MNLRLKVLGGVSLTRGDQPIAGGAAQRRNLALLAILALHAERGITREKVGALLWPDADEASTRNNLKQALHVLRRDLGAEAVVGTTVLKLVADVVAADVVEFERAIARDDLGAAVDCYGGPLLDGFHPGEPADEFEPWVDSHRARLARAHHEALESLASRAAAAGDHRMALRWWSRLLAIDPLDAVSAAGAIAALACSGDRAGAHRAYEAHVASLAREGLSPSPVVHRALAEPGPVAASLVAAPLVATPLVATPLVATPLVATPLVAAQPRLALPPEAKPNDRLFARRLRMAILFAGLAAAAASLTLAAAATHRADPYRLAIGTVSGDDAASTARVHQLANAIARRLSDAGIATPSVIEVGPSRWDAAAARSGAGLALVIEGDDGPNAHGCVATLIDTRTAAHLWSAPPSETDCASSPTLLEHATAATAARLDRRLRNWIHVASGPSTVESYLEFRAGIDLYAATRTEEAEQRFRLAAARDPGFTIARIMTAWANYYAHNGQAPESALAISDSISTVELRPLDRAMVEQQTAVFRRDYSAAYEKAGQVVAAAPKAEWRYLLAESAILVGRGREAVRVMANLEPETGWLERRSPIYWVTFQRALHLIGDHARELEVLDQAQKQTHDFDVFQLKVAALAAAGRLEDAKREIDRSQSAAGSGDRFLPLVRAMAEFRAHGYSTQAARIAEMGLSYFDHLPAVLQPNAIWWRVELLVGAGRLDEARHQLDQVPQFNAADSLEALTVRAVLAADLKDNVTARSIAATLRHSAGADSVPEVLIARAQVAVGLGDREEAVRLLRVAYSRDFSWRTHTHSIWPFDRLRGWPPFDELVAPID